PSWLVFELVLTKLPHYTMPMYPALALLCARAVYAAETRRLLWLASTGIRRALAAFWGFSLGLALGVGAAGAWLAPGPFGAAAATLAAVGVGVVALALRAMQRQRYLGAQGLLMVAAAALWVGALGLALPASPRL